MNSKGNKKGSLKFYSVLLCLIVSSTAKTQSVFGKLFQDSIGVNYPSYLITSSYGNTFIIGGTTSHGFFLSKFDSTGSSIWGKRYLIDSISVRLKSVVQTPDSGFICTGEAFQMAWLDGFFISKIDKNGNSQWIKYYWYPFQGYLINKAVYHSSGFIFVITQPQDPGNGNGGQYGLGIMKFDASNGQFIDERSFFNHVSDPQHRDMVPVDILVDNSSNIICICSNINFTTGGDTNSYFFSFDVNLNLLISRIFSHSQSQLNFSSIDQLASGDYVITGGCRNSSWQNSPFFLKLDMAGQIIAQKKYSITDYASNICSDGVKILSLTNGNMFLVSGSAGNPFLFAPATLQILKIDPNGDTLETHSYRGTLPSDVTLSQDGNPISLFGHSDYLYGFKNIILKTDQNGFYSCNEFPTNVQYDTSSFYSLAFTPFATQNVLSLHGAAISDSSIQIYTDDYCLFTSVHGNGDLLQTSISIFPNPTTGKFQLTITNLQNSKSELEMFDELGNKIFSSAIQNQKTEIDISSQPSGIYFVRLVSENKTYSAKIIKE